VLPDFLIIGAPKAGTTALHRALLPHPQLYLSPVKEPKFFLGDGSAPPHGQRGPGDAHSAREWIWRRADYEALFDAAPPGTRRGESTPFYLYDRGAHARIATLIPDAKLIVVVRDPVERAYSNWVHAWSDGLEPIDDFAAACAVEDERVAAGWAPFWHYTRLGRYGEQLEQLYRHFPRDQVHVLRYKDLVDEPRSSLNDICAFLGIEPDLLSMVPPENTRRFVTPSARARLLGRVIRTGAAAGAYAPPQVWRQVSRPLVWTLQRNGTARPDLDAKQRRALIEQFEPDIRTLEALTDRSYDTWLHDAGHGEFSMRRAASAQDMSAQ
jgi:hypothetical protein